MLEVGSFFGSSSACSAPKKLATIHTIKIRCVMNPSESAERIAIYPALWMKPNRSFAEPFRFVGWRTGGRRRTMSVTSPLGHFTPPVAGCHGFDGRRSVHRVLNRSCRSSLSAEAEFAMGVGSQFAGL